MTIDLLSACIFLLSFPVHIYTTVFFHEMGHYVTGYALGLDPRIILITGRQKPRLRFKLPGRCFLYIALRIKLDARILFMDTNKDSWRWCLMLLSGALINVLMAIIYFHCWHNFCTSDSWKIFFSSGFYFNIAGIVNLLPFRGSDGYLIIKKVRDCRAKKSAS